MIKEYNETKIINQLIEIVEYGKQNCLFYNYKFSNKSIKKLEDFRMLPVTKSEELYENTPPHTTNILTNPTLSNSYVFITGGTTNKPKYVFRNFEDFDDQAKYFKSQNFSKTDRVANLFAQGMWGCFTSWNKGLEKLNCFILPIGSSSLKDNIIDATLKVFEDLKINALIAVPSTIIKFALFLEKKPNSVWNPERALKILVGGELMTPSMIKFMKSIFKNADIRSLYATTEIGGVGYQCEFCKPNQYHVFKNIFLEIVNKDNPHLAVKANNRGEILATNLNKRIMPIIRFSTGDEGKFIDNCSCNSNDPKIEIFGRMDNILCVGSTNIPLNLISEVVELFPELTQNFQLIADKEGPQDVLIVKIEAKTEKLPKKLKDQVKTAINNTCSEPINNLTVQFLPIGGIERNPRNNKIKRIIDYRWL
ncbi:AMP-binding protein [Candidatus Woesearchaeota archaeon]|nr:AMP-binding protein [Candidatus Woesearchaeota archaeon]